MIDRWLEAAEQGRDEELLELHRRGAPVNATDEWGQTALMLAVKGRHSGAVRVLLRNSAEVNAENRVSWTAMTYAVTRPSPRFPIRSGWFSFEGATDLIEMLKEAGGRITLREAVILGDLEMARAMCDAGADASGDARWHYHDTFLMVAADLGHRELVRLLLDRGADIEGIDDLGATALMRAAGAGHADIVTMLLDQGANIDKNWPGETALTEAATKFHPDVVSLLLARGATRGLLDAAALDDVPLVEKLLRGGADPNDLYCGHGSIAMYAVSRGNTSIVRLLLDYGAGHQGPIDDRPVLSEAARLGYADIVALLIERGADHHAVDQDGMTALAWAREGGHREVVDCLEKAARR